MPKQPEQSDKPAPERHLEMNFRVAEFPSDVLSVRRFRVLYPDNFDCPDRIADGYSNNNFFFPLDAECPEHLVRLTELIQDERVIASGAFYRCYLDRHPNILSDEDKGCLYKAKARLEQNYQLFRLADSPETARLLIRQVEEEGELQAHQARAKGR